LTFTLFFDDQGEILRRLLELYSSSRRTVKVIDLTYGRGALWSTIFDDPTLRRKYRVTKCDAAPTVKGVKKRSLLTDDYSSLGKHDVALFDPPYLIGRRAFDYGKEQTSRKSWAKAGGLKKHTSNQTLEQFNRRVECVRDKAKSFLRPGGLLIVKVLDPRYKHRLICHHINIANALRESFELIDIGVYVRQGASTWKINGNLHNAHGYWLTFRLHDYDGTFDAEVIRECSRLATA
jgi:hypothetical protein